MHISCVHSFVCYKAAWSFCMRQLTNDYHVKSRIYGTVVSPSPKMALHRGRAQKFLVSATEHSEQKSAVVVTTVGIRTPVL